MNFILSSEVEVLHGLLTSMRAVAQALLPAEHWLSVDLEGSSEDDPPLDYLTVIFSYYDGEGPPETSDRAFRSAWLQLLQTYDDKFGGELKFIDADDSTTSHKFEIDAPSGKEIQQVIDVFTRIIYEFFVDGRQPIPAEQLALLH